MCRRVTIQFKCERCGGRSRDEDSQIQPCLNPLSHRAKVQLKPIVERTTGWCDNCGARPGYEAYGKQRNNSGGHLVRSRDGGSYVQLSNGVGRAGPVVRRKTLPIIPPAAGVGLQGTTDGSDDSGSSTAVASDGNLDGEVATGYERRLFEQHDTSRLRHEARGEVNQQHLEAHHAANGRSLEQQARRGVRQLDEQRNEMEKKFAEECESNSSILSRQQREITEVNDVKAALRKEADHAKAMLDDLHAVQAVLQRDTEKAQTKLDELKESQRRVHQEVHREQAELHNLKATKRRLEQEVDQDKERVEDLRRTRRRLEKEVDQEKEGLEDMRRTRRQLERQINELRDARDRDMRGGVRWQSPIRSPRSPAVHAASTNGSYHPGRPAVENERRRDGGIRLERHRVGDGFHRGDVIRVCKRSHEDDHGRRHAI